MRHRDLFPVQLLPDLARPVGAEVLVPDALDLRAKLLIPAAAGWNLLWIARPRLELVVRGGGDRQLPADRLDPESILVFLDVAEHHLPAQPDRLSFLGIKEPALFGILEPVLRADIPSGSSLPALGVGGNFLPRTGRESRRAERLAVKHQAVGIVPQAIQGCRGEQAVGGERLIPLTEVQVAGDQGGGLLVALGDQIVQVLVGGWAQGLQPEVIDDEQRDARKGCKLALVAAGSAGGVEAGGQLCASKT